MKRYLKRFLLKRKLKHYQEHGYPLKINLGAGDDNYAGWIATDMDVLDLEKESDWRALFEEDSIEALLAEHVLDYFTIDQALDILKRCYRYLKKGGHLRIAVPDGLLPDRGQINYEKRRKYKKFLYDYMNLSDLIEKAGFEVRLLEYWDENAIFKHQVWDGNDGFIHRSMDNDERNKNTDKFHTSIIVDAIKIGN